MARTDTLSNFLTDICDAVREKTGETGTIKASELDTKISDISTGNNNSLVTLSNFTNSGYPQKGVVEEDYLTNTTEAIFSCYGGTSGYVANGVHGYFKELTEIVLPSNITYVPKHLARFAHKLTTINLSDDITEIRDYAFYYCNSLKMTMLPKQLKNIGAYSFYACKDITELTIWENIEKINSQAFYYCYFLSKVVLNVTSVPTLGQNVFYQTPISKGTGYIYVPDDLVDSFKSATNWSSYGDQIKGVSELE